VLSGKVLAADVLGKTQSVASVEGGKLSVDGSGGKVVINGGPTVIAADVLATNGVIHGIDGVLLPTIVDTAIGYDDGTTKFSTLVTALTAADLVTTLSGKGPFTVFAPTDAAFAALKASVGDAAFSAILADKAKLTKILTYHVVGAAVYSKDVMAGDVKTVEGDTIKLGTTGGVTVGDSTTTAAKVVLADLPNSNGVIHVIDKVLLPPGLLGRRGSPPSSRAAMVEESNIVARFVWSAVNPVATRRWSGNVGCCTLRRCADSLLHISPRHSRAC
jgi:transforming growth factor-beta-induced protein